MQDLIPFHPRQMSERTDQELKAYQQQPSTEERERLDRRFDEIFERRYPHHASLNLALQQFCAHKQELLRVLDAPQVPLHRAC